MANGSIGAVFQATVSPEYQGRVFALIGSVAAAMTPVGLLLATPIADFTGVRTWYLAGGLVCTILGAATFFVRPIREMEGLPAIEEVPPEADVPTQVGGSSLAKSKRSEETPGSVKQVT